MAVGTDLYTLPEGCVAVALSLTSPRDACRLSLVSSMFRAAAQSDAVWDRFLPSDCLDIIARSNANLDVIRSFELKKELFLYLSDNHFLIDDGTKSFWLDKRSGKKSYMLPARELHIVWGDSPEYWGWISLPGSRFMEVAKLLDVCWLEIGGKIKTDMLSPKTTYAAYLVFSTTAGIQGFDYCHAEGSFGISGQDSRTHFVCLDPMAARSRKFRTRRRRQLWRFRAQAALVEEQSMVNSDFNAQGPEQRDDGWMEVLLGEYFVEGTENVELEMSLKEVKGGNWKSGIIVEGIEIRPKHVK